MNIPIMLIFENKCKTIQGRLLLFILVRSITIFQNSSRFLEHPISASFCIHPSILFSIIKKTDKQIIYPQVLIKHLNF